jgi:hypothetical protein
MAALAPSIISTQTPELLQAEHNATREPTVRFDP